MEWGAVVCSVCWGVGVIMCVEGGAVVCAGEWG